MSSPSKLFSCVDPDVILKSPLNSSVSKMHWSFSRSSRFPKQKPKQQIVYYASCDQLYQIPDNKQMRSTSFGYGKRSKVELEGTNREIPPSNRYHIDSFVEINKKRSCGVGLGKGRDVSVYLFRRQKVKGYTIEGMGKIILGLAQQITINLVSN